MQALVLAGGEGTRLRPLTLTRPKPALPLAERPFLLYMLDWLERHGVDDVIVASGFGAAELREALGERLAGGGRLRYIEEAEPLGTAGPVRLAADAGILGERFLVLNGDVLTDLDLGAHLAAHAERGAVASLALYPVADPSAYGLVRRAGDGRVTGFVEKPGPGAPGAGAGPEAPGAEINAGAYVLERRVLDLIPAGRAVSIEREVFPRLVGHGLYGLRLDGYWMDIGTPERYLQATWDILEGRVETAAGAAAGGLALDESCEVEPGASLEPPALVAAGARIGDGAVAGPRLVLGRNCEAGAGATLADSVLMAGCVVGEGATVEGAILGPGVEVGAGAVVPAGAVVGEGARLEAGAELEADARLEPGGVAV